MCGIGLIVSGVELPTKHSTTAEEKVLDGANLTAEHLIEALKKRGPDTIGRHTVLVEPNGPKHTIDDNKSTTQNGDMPLAHNNNDNHSNATLEFVATTLQLRGALPISQPLRDHCNNVLIYNGEVFDGLPIKFDENDGQVLLDLLHKCCSCHCHSKCAAPQSCSCTESKVCTNSHASVPELLSTIKGPWALVFWQAESRMLWFGRDALGRRSLLVHWPSQGDQRLVFSSVSPGLNVGDVASKTESIAHGFSMFDYWEELPCGIYSCSIKVSIEDQYDGSVYAYKGRLEEHGWEDAALVKMVAWERYYVEPPLGKLESDSQGGDDALQVCTADCMGFLRSETKTTYPLQVLAVLKESVRRRTSNIFKHEWGKVECFDMQRKAEVSMVAPVAILFSGGLDSMILAAVADQCLAPQWSIDLLNVSFEGQSAPDRISAIAGIKELRNISPSRRWKLVEVDGDPLCIGELHSHLLSLICPSKTHMDLNIGTALWLAAQGHGWVKDGTSRKQYKSEARVILVGSGADEQCAGYGRHRTKFKEGGWKALEREMRLDMQRLWKRNMGRDDRCIADHGKEARFPFLDEDVIQSLLDIPLWDIVDLGQPSGQGDKKILREIALVLGLKSAASLPKRAIQFGSRIAQESNRRNFGSNRAANQASAGSATLHYLQRQDYITNKK